MYETQYSYFINPATKKFLQTNEAHSPITTPPSFYFGDRPKFTLSFPADTIAEGDTLIAVLDNENRFLDTKQATGLNPVMTGVLHEVTSEEAGAQSLEIQLFDYSKKFADVINGHDNAVTCLFTVYLKSTDGEGNFTFVELGQTIANGEPTVTSPECIWDDLPVTKYYTREELDAIYNQFLAGVSLVVEYSNLAKSYAVGGTGTREGEDDDNAKYYAEMASQAANAVSTMYLSIQTLATQIANTKEYIDGLVESIAIDIRDISAIAASVTATAAQVSRDAQSVRQAKSSVDASVQFVAQAKSTVENLATQVSQNAVNVANDKDTVAQLAVQVSNAASQVSRDKADAKGYAESAATSLSNVQTIQTDVTQKQTAVTTMKNTIQSWYTQIQTWYNSIQAYVERMLGWWTDVDTWQQQVSEDKAVVVSAKDTAVQAKDDAVAAKNDAVSAKETAVDAKDTAVDAKDTAVDAKDTSVQAKNDAVTAKGEAEAALQEFESRLSSSYVYGIDWKDADLQQNVAGKCIVLNNIYDNIQYDASLRYMQLEAHGVLPAHNWKRCAMRTARSVNYYLHQSNSNMKADGTPAVLTGADGDILSEVDIVYFRVDKYTDSQNVNHTVWLCSDKPFNGSSPNPFFYVSPDGRTLRKQYVASFRSCVCDADGNTLNNNKTATADTTYQADKAYWTRSNNVFTKLTAGTDYTVGGTITQGSTVDTKIYENTVVASPAGFSAGRKYRSIVGALPAASATRAQFRSGHANNGFDSINFLWGSFMGIMMAIEYGTLSAQAKFSVGYSNLSEWNYKAMRLTGRTAIFGNNSGEIIADDIDAEGEDYDLLTMKNGGTLWNSTAQNNHAQRVVQCSYRGIEDPFGSQFTLDDGIQKNQNAIDLSITYNGLVYLRDEDDDPQTISLYCWKNGTTKFYTTSDTPSVGLNLYANTNLTTVTGTVAAVGEVTIMVGTTTYTRSSADDTTGHSYAWKSGDSVIYSHVVNPHTDANTREVFSDAQLTDKLGNVTSVVDDYSESGYWFTQSTNKYSYLDTDRGRLKGSEYVFPVTGYSGEEAVWVHHEWPKASGYYCYFDTITFYPIYRAGNWGSATKGLCDYFYNDASAGARVVARLGTAYLGSLDGPFSAYTNYSLPLSTAYFGSRLAA